MKPEQKTFFLERWNRYFPGAELPIVFYYSQDAASADKAAMSPGLHCFVSELVKVRKGESLAFDVDAISCAGGKRYLGFAQELRPDFDYFLSCGIPGEVQGERYKKTPALVDKYDLSVPPFHAPGNYIVFKRWDCLAETDEPSAVIFFGHGDILSGLFTLANFDEMAPDAVIAPFCAGCGSIVYYPYQQSQSENPKAILGMFDVSARPSVAPEILSFAVPWPKFTRMVENMDESFLINDSWNKLRVRIKKP